MCRFCFPTLVSLLSLTHNSCDAHTPAHPAVPLAANRNNPPPNFSGISHPISNSQLDEEGVRFHVGHRRPLIAFRQKRMGPILGSRSHRCCWEETEVGWLLERSVWSDAKTRRSSCKDVLTWCMWATFLLMMKLIYMIKEDRFAMCRDGVRGVVVSSPNGVGCV